MAAEFCPTCGNQRTGSFRFCRSCGFDFDLLPPPSPRVSDETARVSIHERVEVPVQAQASVAATPAAPVVSKVASRRPIRRYAVIGAAIVLGLAIVGSWTGNNEQPIDGVAGRSPALPTNAAIVTRSSHEPSAAPSSESAAPVPSPEPTSTPAPTPVVSDELIEVFDSHKFAGGKQEYAWNDVSLFFDEAVFKVYGRAPATQSCKVAWAMSDGVDRNGFTMKVSPGDTKTRSRSFEPAVTEGILSVRSTCKAWAIKVTEYVAPTPKPTSGRDCHPSYEGACLKPHASDYDCAGGSGNGPYYVEGPIRVVGYDVFDLDRDGDGIGCD